ncbi:hypothetical protein [Mycobacterium sp. Z3061]|nr:hypothetical protein [Mycobacterium sp. Z3061]
MDPVGLLNEADIECAGDGSDGGGYIEMDFVGKLWFATFAADLPT